MPAKLTDERKRLWSRIIFLLGMLWGVIPLISLPMILFAISSPQPGDLTLAGLVNGMTILPASALAFWKRRLASWWLIADAFVVAMVGSNHLSNYAMHGSELIMGVLVPALLGGFGLFSEKERWPTLLDPNTKLGSSLF
jgi:hypothetical protein